MKKVPFLNYVGAILFMFGSIGLLAISLSLFAPTPQERIMEERLAIDREHTQQQEVYTALQVAATLFNAQQSNIVISVSVK